MAITGIITDVDVFTEPLKHIADGEALNGEHFKEELQGAANRTRHLKNRIDALAAAVEDLLAQRHGASFNVNGGVAQDQAFGLTAITNPGALYAVASGEITVPEPGLYYVAWRIRATTDVSTAGVGLSARVRLGGAGNYAVSTVNRYSTETGEALQMSQSELVPIANPATETVSLRNRLAATLTVSDPSNSCRLTIFRVGAL